jgi:hypothetical protein
MAKAIDTTISFQERIREFCRQRLDDQPDEIHHHVRDYMLGLTTSRGAIPTRNGKTDWRQIALNSNVDFHSLLTLKESNRRPSLSSCDIARIV